MNFEIRLHIIRVHEFKVLDLPLFEVQAQVEKPSLCQKGLITLTILVGELEGGKIVIGHPVWSYYNIF